MMLLLLPAVSRSLVDLLVSEHAGAANALSDGLAKKSARGESPSLLWLRLVRNELAWCVQNFDKLTARHRLQACELLDWYYAQTGYVPESWFAVYPAREFYYRSALAEIDWCARHVDSLTAAQRDDAIDLLEDFCAANPNEFRSEWNVLYW